MSPLVRKEVRLVLVPAVLALFMAVLPAIWNTYGAGIGVAGFALAMLIAGVSSFGRELNAHTFSSLLALPVERRHVWRLKSLLLLALLAIGAVILWLSFQYHLSTRVFASAVTPEPVSILVFAIVAMGAAVCGTGLWATLLFRQVAVSICFSVLVPLAIVAAVMSFAGNREDSNHREIIAAAVALFFYSVIAFGWARVLFLGAQDKQWSGGVIAMPQWLAGRGADTSATITRRSWRPVAALLRKELQLQHGTLMLAAGIALLHIGAVVLRIVLAGKFAQNSLATVMLEVFGLAWLFVPLMAGCTAVADERRTGTMETQLCLPTAMRKQFAAKFGVALLLSLLFGGVLQSGIEAVSAMIGQRVIPFGDAPSYLVAMNVMAACIFFVAFYASTLTRSVTEALALALTVSVLLFMGWSMNNQQPHDLEGFRWPRRLVTWLGPPVLVIVLARISAWNFRRAQITAHTWTRNLVTIVVTLVILFLTVFTFYNRAWEFVMTGEPEHGPARFTTNDPVEFSANSRYVAARLPDGRAWFRATHFEPAIGFFSNIAVGKYVSEAITLDGTNWQAVTAGSFQCAALKTDGTLWSVATDIYRAVPRHGLVSKQIGLDRDWQSIAAGHAHFTAVKRDGTLWVWGSDWIARRNHFPTNDVPTLLNGDTNWTAVFAWGAHSAAVKRDGTIWHWEFYTPKTNVSAALEIKPALMVGMGTNGAITLNGTGDFNVAVPGDNTLSAWGSGVPIALLRTGVMTTWGNTNIVAQLSAEPVWRDAVSGHGAYPFVVGLKRDGTLWQWRAHVNWRIPATSIRYEVEPLSHHSDWLAVERAFDSPVALAADGSIWRWSQQRWTALDIQLPSRRPEKIAVIGQ
ncbi:MAG TPA: ABC transporter permease subunit [Candidatus Acidoferrum sp.]|nr:ABC transporter permease subunit [Candidatus Acidoferrum sp.]